MRTLTIIMSGLIFFAISGCMVPKDDYDKVSAELANSQQLVKEANDAHLKVAEENRQTEITLRETQAKLVPIQKKLDEVKTQLLNSQNAYKKDMAELAKKNETLETERGNATQDAKQAQSKLNTCQSELAAANKKNENLNAMITRQNLIIKDLQKSNAEVKQNTTPEPKK